MPNREAQLTKLRETMNTAAIAPSAKRGRESSEVPITPTGSSREDAKRVKVEDIAVGACSVQVRAPHHIQFFVPWGRQALAVATEFLSKCNVGSSWRGIWCLGQPWTTFGPP